MGNVISSLVIIGVSLFFYYLAGQLPPIKGFQQMGDSFWPRLVLGVLMGLSGILLVQSLWKKQAKKKAEESAPPPADRAVLAKTMGVLVLYILSISYLGFLLSTFLALMAFCYLMGDRKLSGMFIFSLGMTAVIYAVFGLLIYTALPRGVWVFKTLSTYIY